MGDVLGLADFPAAGGERLAPVGQALLRVVHGNEGGTGKAVQAANVQGEGARRLFAQLLAQCRQLLRAGIVVISWLLDQKTGNGQGDMGLAMAVGQPVT